MNKNRQMQFFVVALSVAAAAEVNLKHLVNKATVHCVAL